MRLIHVLLLGVAAFGCVSTGAFDQLPKSERDRFVRCGTPTRAVRCGSDTDPVYVAMCDRGSAAEYAEQPGPKSRMEWLVAHGCPPSMVQPERFVETPAETAPRATAPVSPPDGAAQ